MLQKSSVNPSKRIALVMLSAIVAAFNINTFVHAGGLIPGGFTGITLLINQITIKFFGFHTPFSPIFILINAIPAIICFKYIGKWFTIYSVINILLTGFLTDCMPTMFTDFLQLQDALLNAVFGGFLNAFAISLCLFVDTTSGGTDFIAIFFAEKKGKDMWNMIFAGNIVLLIIAGSLLSLDKALYSIIFQFTTTSALRFMYRGYQQQTLLIITERPTEVYCVIRDKTNHDATSFSGLGHYKNEARTMLYSVVSANDIQHLISEIKKIDEHAFINMIKTEELTGKFFRRPKN
ncbi:MAG: YitT family protein [Termitinemataceae bacterium]|nr:MAG: YitT family protein [Termitinemataceae bacterium]